MCLEPGLVLENYVNELVHVLRHLFEAMSDEQKVSLLQVLSCSHKIVDQALPP